MMMRRGSSEICEDLDGCWTLLGVQFGALAKEFDKEFVGFRQILGKDRRFTIKNALRDVKLSLAFGVWGMKGHELKDQHSKRVNVGLERIGLSAVATEDLWCDERRSSNASVGSINGCDAFGNVEICDGTLKDVLLLVEKDEDVLALDVTMDDVVFVKEGETRGNSTEDRSENRGIETNSFVADDREVIRETAVVLLKEETNTIANDLVMKIADEIGMMWE